MSNTLIEKLKGIIPSFKSTKNLEATVDEKPVTVDLEMVNQYFAKANEALTKGNTEALDIGIAEFQNCLKLLKGTEYAPVMKKAIYHLNRAAGHHNVADKTNPFYDGLFKWKFALADRDDELKEAWDYISQVNDYLKINGKGWRT
jgi:hypothetical protein